MEELKRCLKCGESKAIAEFTRHKKCKNGIYSRCKPCTYAQNRIWTKANYARLKVARSAYYKTYNSRHAELSNKKYKELKEAVYLGYGKCCARCGYSQDSRALVVDHVAGNGNYERNVLKLRPPTLWRRIIEAKFPAEYQILCANCNMIKMYDNKEFPGWRSRAEAT